MSADDKKKEDYVLRCFFCKTEYKVDDYGKFYKCAKCGNLLEVKRVPKSSAGAPKVPGSRLGVWKYFDLIPLWSEKNIVSLLEGGTTLFECRILAQHLGFSSVYVKFEGLNPTGSFKDRGMTVGVSKAVEQNFTSAMCASTGNTSASLAAYTAKAGMRCIVLVPKGKIAMGKMAQAIAYGAEIFQVDGNFDDSLRVASEICERDRKILLLNSLNPFRIEGQKTVSFEIVEQLEGEIPEYVVLPVGNGGNISAAWKGFSEILEDGLEVAGKNYAGETPPRMIAIQAEGASPIARAFRTGARDSIEFVSDPHTEASAINIGSPVSWRKALAAIYDSNGLADKVSDEEIFAAQRLIASKEGIFVEPASATPIAYLSRIASEKSDQYEQMRDSKIVCICTGNGLKDPNAVLKGVSHERLPTIYDDAKYLEKILE